MFIIPKRIFLSQRASFSFISPKKFSLENVLKARKFFPIFFPGSKLMYQGRSFSSKFKNQSEQEERDLQIFKDATSQDPRKSLEEFLDEFDNLTEEEIEARAKEFMKTKVSEDSKSSDITFLGSGDYLDSKTIKNQSDFFWRGKLHPHQFM